MFSDEPPPLDDFNDELSPKLKDQGIFSGGDGLFDDLNDDESFWGGSVIEQQRKGWCYGLCCNNTCLEIIVRSKI